MEIRSKTADWLRCLAAGVASAVLAVCLATGLTAGSAGRALADEAASPRIAMVMELARTTVRGASAEPVSVVVIANQKRLFAFVDRYDSSEPLSGAELRIDTPRQTLDLSEVSPGIYQSEPYLPPASVTPLTVRLALAGASASGAADLLVPRLADTVPGAVSAHRPIIWAGVAVALIVVLLWLWQHPVAIRRRWPGRPA
ncbi:hypothetical protein [Azospirillum sp. B506]|uniref:hypothetical protein n=1 Tax=Azospirillum sp. B506 TaxID=137721 RepID=UPI000349D216|nr:hypothetical protein [Azospirillum sp. B506]